MSTQHLPAGQVLTVTASAGKAGTLHQLASEPLDPDRTSTTTLDAGASLSVGPFPTPTRWELVDLSYVAAVFDSLAQLPTSPTSGIHVRAIPSGVALRLDLTLDDVAITLTDDAGVGQFGSVQLLDLPAGSWQVLGGTVDANLALTETEWVDTAEGDVSVGTTAIDDGDAQATTEIDIIPKTDIAAMVSQAGPIDCKSTASVTLAAAGTTDANVHLNVRIDDNAAHITGGGVINGVATFVAVHLGDIG